MKKILFYTNIPSPYRVDFFSELGKYCDLTVLFETSTSTERDESWGKYKFDNFRGIVMKGFRTHVDRAFCPDIIKYLKHEKYDHIVVTIMASATAMLAVTYMKIYGISYCYEGDGAILGNNSGVNGIKTAIKKYIIGSAEKCFSTGKCFDEYCIRFGARPEKIIRYPLSSVFEKDVLPEKTDYERRNIRKEFGISNDKRILLGVGRFANIKGWDVLIKAVRILDEKWEIILIGGPDTIENREILGLNRLKTCESKTVEMCETGGTEDMRCAVRIMDFMPREKILKYMQAADLFVLPTRYDPWGLVVGEAMAQGCPVVTSDMCVAGLEMIEQGVNGFVFESERDDDLSKILESIDEDFDCLNKMGEKALVTARSYTIESMVQAHVEAFYMQ